MFIRYNKNENRIEIQLEEYIERDIYPFCWGTDPYTKESILILSVSSDKTSFAAGYDFIKEFDYHIYNDTFEAGLTEDAMRVFASGDARVIFDKNSYVSEQITQSEMVYVWSQLKRSKAYAMKLGDVLVHNFVIPRSVEEIRNTSVHDIAEFIYNVIDEDGRQYINRPFYDNTYCAMQDWCEKTLGDSDELIEQYEHFVSRKLEKAIKKWKEIYKY